MHCFDHQLQLALDTASREVSLVHQFFSNLSFIINVIVTSPKRLDELHANKGAKVEFLLSISELQTSKGLNQIGTLKRAGDTRWSSHLQSIRSLITMFKSSISVLENISFDKTCKFSQRGDADAALNLLISYDFVFIAHLMIEILQNVNTLYQALQQKSQNIVSVLKLVSTTKRVLQTFREDGWHTFIEKVKKKFLNNMIF